MASGTSLADFQPMFGKATYTAAALVILLPAATATGVVNPATLGAQIDESLATWLIYVNPAAPNASDENPGTEALPVVTLSRAAQLALAANRGGAGVRVRIAPGTYRETLRIEGTLPTNMRPIIFEAVTNGSVIISGSDMWTGWAESSPAGTYFHSWPHRWGMVPYPAGWEAVVLPELMRRREMVFVNGTRLRQVMSAQLLVAGSFFVSESSAQVQIVPPAGVRVETASIEVAQRASLVHVQHATNLVLRGVTVRHDTSGIGGAALSIYNSSNVLVEDLVLDSNNYRGMAIADTSRLTVRRTTANFNGAGGMAGYKMRSTLFEDTTTSYNNWRGAESGFTDWDPAGIKLMLLHSAALVRSTLIGNQAYGLWLDTDCVDVLIQGLVANENLNDGLFVEAVQGPITVDASTMNKNGRSGLLISNAATGTLSRSALIDNRASQLLISGDPGGRLVDDFETGQRYPGIQSRDWIFTGNTIHALTPTQSLTATTLPVFLWQVFVDSIQSDWNRWYNPSVPHSFHWANGQRLDFAGWKQQTRQDEHSVFTGSSAPSAPVNVRSVTPPGS